MPEQLLDELPILRELGEDLKAAFQTREIPARDRRFVPPGPAGWLLSAAGAAAAVAGVVIAFVLGFQGGSPTPPSATAALYQAADAATRHPQPFPRDDQFWYIRSIDTSLIPVRKDPLSPLTLRQLRSLPHAIVTSEGQTWYSADRVGRTTSNVISVKFPTKAARRRWERLGQPSFGGPPGFPSRIAPVGNRMYLLGNIALTREQLLATSPNPHTLYRELYAHNNGNGTAEVFTEIADTLRGYPAPARLRAALYRTLALVPGIRFIGPERDSTGRRGLAVGFVQQGIESELIFDPKTSDMLQERTIVLASASKRLGDPPGTVTSSTTYLQRAVTNTLSRP